MSDRSLPGGEHPTFRISICKNYDASLPKEENNRRVAAGWEIQEVPWTYEAVKTLVIESGISPSFLKGGKRSKSTWEGVGSIMLDFDDGKMNVADLTSIQETWEFDSYIFSSQNHQKEKNGQEACDRLRAFIPLSRDIYDPGEVNVLKEYFLKTVPGIDASCFTLSQYFAHGTPIVSSFECGHGFLDVDRAMEYVAPSPSGKGPNHTNAVLEGLKRDELDKRIGIPSPEDISVPEAGEYPVRVQEEIRKHLGGVLAQTLSGTRAEGVMYKSSPDGVKVHDRSMHDIALAGICFRIGCTAHEVIETMLACPHGKAREQWSTGSYDGYEYVLHKVRDAYKRYESEKEANLGDDPPAMAERFLRKQYPRRGEWPTLLRWQDRLYAFTGTHWAPLEEAELDHQINAFLATTEKREKAGTHYEASVKRNVIAKVHLSNKVGLGEWLDGRDEGFQVNLKSGLLSVNEWLKGKSKPMHWVCQRNCVSSLS